MKADGDILVILAVQFSIIALLSFGGANAVLPEIHRQAVDVRGWITERNFADMFAIAQAIPGPSIMIVTLLGYQVAGFWGALVITLAMCGPTSLLAGVLSGTWYRFKDAPWRVAVQAGLVPISVGLVGATAMLLTHVAVHSIAAGVVAAATAAVTFWSRWNPLWFIAAAGLAGLAGVVT
jgi:chromate transporter